jgi:lysophospholipase L1-like esterase
MVIGVKRFTFVQIQRLVLVLLASAATAAVTFAVVGASQPSGTTSRGQTHEVASTQPPVFAAPTTRPSVLFIGDSFTAGATIQEERAYPALIARRELWDLHVDAQGGTGFIADGYATGNGDTSRLIDRLAADAHRYPRVDLVIIDAGRNDLSHPVGQLTAAMSQYLSAIRRQWPEAKIVTLVPSYVSPGAYESYPALIETLAAAASAVGGVLIDPVAEGWYDAVDTASMLSADGVHPNTKGSAYIGARILTSLRDSNIAFVS